jgi:hypothetical protein
VIDALLDRIVEGDLSPADLREALDRLERDPDGWKRCALAFLEAQCWRESFRAIDHQGSTIRDSSAPPAPTRTRPDRPGWHRLSIAAGIAALSFALGWRSRPLEPSSPRTSVASATAKADRTTSDRPVAAIAPPGFEDRQPEEVAATEVDPRSPITGHADGVPVGGGPAIPVAARSGIGGRWGGDPSPPITEHQQALLAQRGYQVDRRRRLVSATLSDGRRVTMPIEQIQLRYQGNEPL